MERVLVHKYQEFKFKELVFPGLVSLVFLIAVWWLPATTAEIFNSPDEMANFYFAKEVARHNTLTVREPLNDVLEDHLYPRSILAKNGTLRPISFVGLPRIYGLLAKIFTTASIRFFTGLFAVAGGLFFYFLLRRRFNIFWSRLGLIL